MNIGDKSINLYIDNNKENLIKDKPLVLNKENNSDLSCHEISSDKFSSNLCSNNLTGSADKVLNLFKDDISSKDISEKNKKIETITKGIVSIKIENNKPVAFREKVESLSLKDEISRRQSSYDIFSKLHFAKEGDFHSGSLEIKKDQKDLFHKFAMTDIGADLIQKVIDDDIEAFNKGYLELSKDPITEDSKFVDTISGKLSVDAEFEGYNLFRVYGYEGGGGQGQSGAIGLGNKGFKESFITGEKVDPLAILSHEFGHTKYGDPSSGENLEGEAQTVLKYENPMRKSNGFSDREIYYSPNENISIEVKTKKIHKGLLNIDQLNK